MAITGRIYPTAYMDQIDDFTFQTYDYAIGGKMVVGKAILSHEYSELVFQNTDDEAKRKIKSSLVHQMAEFMLENKLVEFTYHVDQASMRYQVMARAYLAPDDQVKILRVANKIV